MDDPVQSDLRRRTWELLQPGEIQLDGLVVATALDGSQEPEMHQVTVEIGELIAEAAGYEPTETYVFSGTEDPEFASNQHQGRTLEEDAFVWECQQLLRDGTFDLVFYFEASADATVLLTAVREAGYDAIAVRGGADTPETAVRE